MKRDQARSHAPRLVKLEHLMGEIHGTHPIGRFNAWTAIKVTNLLSSMWFFWFCAALDVAELFLLVTGVMPIGVIFITFLSQTVIQLLALPAISAGQKLLSAASDARAEADHETLTAMAVMNQHQLELLEQQADTIGRLAEKVR